MPPKNAFQSITEVEVTPRQLLLGSTPNGLNAFSVLIVEDHLATQAIHAKLATSLGLTVHVSSSAAECLKKIDNEQIDLILLDIGLPDASGTELLKAWQPQLLKQSFAVIVISGTDEEEKIVESLQLGAYDYLTKPVRPHVLRHKLINAQRYFSTNRSSRQLNQQLSAMISSVPDGMVTMAKNGDILWSNDNFYTLFNLSKQDFSSVLLSKFFAEGLSSNQNPHSEHAFIGNILNSDVSLRYTGLRADGSTFPAEIKTNKIEGENEHWLVTIRDMTDAERIIELERNFVSIVSHELRTPLTSIKGALSMLEATDKDKISQPGRKMLDIASRNSERLSRIINDILDMEKLSSGNFSIHLQPTPIVSTIRNSIDYAQGRSLSVNINISLVHDPLIDSNTCVAADPERLEQIIANFLSNAIKFSPEDSIITVRIQTEASDRIRITVEDQGSGLPEDFALHAFKPFYQAQGPSNRRQGGTGLGLSIVKALAERMHAEVGFASNNGQGSKFHVILPMFTQTAPPATESPA